MSPHPIRRFLVGRDDDRWFVRDTVTGRCQGGYRTSTEALHVARRANRALCIAQRGLAGQ